MLSALNLQRVNQQAERRKSYGGCYEVVYTKWIGFVSYRPHAIFHTEHVPMMVSSFMMLIVYESSRLLLSCSQQRISPISGVHE